MKQGSDCRESRSLDDGNTIRMEDDVSHGFNNKWPARGGSSSCCRLLLGAETPELNPEEP